MDEIIHHKIVPWLKPYVPKDMHEIIGYLEPDKQIKMILERRAAAAAELLHLQDRAKNGQDKYPGIQQQDRK